MFRKFVRNMLLKGNMDWWMSLRCKNEDHALLQQAVYMEKYLFLYCRKYTAPYQLGTFFVGKTTAVARLLISFMAGRGRHE